MHERLPETTTSTRNYRFNGGLHDHCTKDYQRLPNNCSKRMRCCTSYTFRKEWSESVEIRASRLLFSAAPRTSSLFTRREILLLKLYKGNGWSGILKGFIASVVFCWASWRSAFSRIRENVDQRASRRIPKKRLQKKKNMRSCTTEEFLSKNDPQHVEHLFFFSAAASTSSSSIRREILLLPPKDASRSCFGVLLCPASNRI